MVKNLKNNIFWTTFLFLFVLVLSISSKWLSYLDFGVFNYSILFILTILIPNLELVYVELKNSEVERIKLPFCELKLLKKFDYYFVGYKKEDELSGDLIVLGFYKDIFNEKEAKKQFKEEFLDENEYEIIEIIKQVHYKKNDE